MSGLLLAIRDEIRGAGARVLADRGIPLTPARAVLGVAAIIGANEVALTVFGHLLAAQLVGGVLVVLLVNAVARHDSLAREQADDVLPAALAALALVAVIPLAAATLPLDELSEATAELLIALPVGAAAALVSQRFGGVGALVNSFEVRRQAAALALAALLGVLAYLLRAPSLWTSRPALLALAVLAVIVTATVEELVFRGVVQSALARAFGRTGVVVAAALSVCAYVGAGWWSVPAMLAAALFAVVVARLRALLCAMIGRAVFLLGATIVLPGLLDGRRGGWPGSLAAAAIVLPVSVALIIYVAGGLPGRHRAA